MSAHTDQGPYFQVNEDFYQLDLTNNLFMLLDGFGGAGAGDMAVKFVAEQMSRFYLQIAEDPDSTMPFFYSQRYLIEGNALVNAMLFTHKSLIKHNLPLGVDKRGGSSGAFVSLSDNIITICLVGNVYAYLWRHGTLLPLLLPDNYQFLSSDRSTQLQVPTSAFGLFDDLYYQVRECRIADGDKVMLATDGAVVSLSNKELSSILSNEELDIKARINNIFDLANKRGNYDNQSAMILEF